MDTSSRSHIYNFLIQLDPFDKLPTEIVEQIAENVEVETLAKGEVISLDSLCRKPNLYLIRKGVIEQRLQNGELRSRLGVEDQFGFTFFTPLKNIEDGYQAHAVEDSLLYLVPYQQVKDILNKFPEFSDYFSSASARLTTAAAAAKREEKGIFNRKVSEVASTAIVIADRSDSIQSVAQKMSGKFPGASLQVCSSCAVVMADGKIVGLVTDRDMTRSVVSDGVPILSPIETVMTKNPQVIQAGDRVYQAVSIMLEYNIRCLPVVNHGEVVGLLTTSHLVHNHRTQALFLIEKIKYADSVKSLAALKDEREAIFMALVESGMSSEVQCKVMSMIMDAFNRRLIKFAEEVLGPPPCEYAWIVAGSHARNEVHMLSDQDNAIVLSDDAKPEDMLYFKHLAMRVCSGLDACGYPLCTGKYMAATPKWCQPLSRWKEYYHKWVQSPEYGRLLNISVFLEVRGIHGNLELVDELNKSLHQEIHNHPYFLSSLARDAIATQPPLGIFNSLVLEKEGQNSKTLNIKKYALNLIIDLARIFSLSAGGSLTGTEERFRFATEHGKMSVDSCENIIGALRFLSQVRFNHQAKALKEGHEPNNNINPNDFSSFERKHLKEAFKIIAQMQDVAKLRYLK